MRNRMVMGAIGLLVLVSSVASAQEIAPQPGSSLSAHVRSHHRRNNIASYYASRFHGRTTASGDPYDENQLTAAHRTLPFGTRVRVTNLRNARSVIVRVTDRGPFAPGRVIDVSRCAARQLGFLRRGIAQVRLETLTD
jgi:rare lipoprotein A